MLNAYAFSFDRETFQGEYATRELAVEAGLRAASGRIDTIAAVYVGKRVPTDAQAEGHAEAVARDMRRQMLARTGEGGYLATANEHLLADLDTAIAKVIVEWLRRHELEPAAKVKSISEHPLPTVHAHGPTRDDEVHLMGGEFE